MDALDICYFTNLFAYREELTSPYEDQNDKVLNTITYTGHEKDYETNLTYMLARYYSQGYGRFLSPDPGYDYDQLDPMSWNLYSYVRGNPVNFLDPFGLKLTPEQKTVLQHLQNTGVISDWREFSQNLTNAVANIDLKDKESANFAFAILFHFGLDQCVDWEKVGKKNFSVFQAAVQFKVTQNINEFREGIDKLNDLIGDAAIFLSPFKPASTIITGVSIWLSSFSYVLSGGDETYLKDIGIDLFLLKLEDLAKVDAKVRKLNLGKYGLRYYSDITKKFIKTEKGVKAIRKAKLINIAISVGFAVEGRMAHIEIHRTQ